MTSFVPTIWCFQRRVRVVSSDKKKTQHKPYLIFYALALRKPMWVWVLKSMGQMLFKDRWFSTCFKHLVFLGTPVKVSQALHLLLYFALLVRSHRHWALVEVEGFPLTNKASTWRDHSSAHIPEILVFFISSTNVRLPQCQSPSQLTAFVVNDHAHHVPADPGFSG